MTHPPAGPDPDGPPPGPRGGTALLDRSMPPEPDFGTPVIVAGIVFAKYSLNSWACADRFCDDWHGWSDVCSLGEPVALVPRHYPDPVNPGPTPLPHPDDPAPGR